MNMLQCDYWLLGTFYLLSPSIAIFMTLCRQICEFPDNSAVKGLRAGRTESFETEFEVVMPESCHSNFEC